LTPRRGGDPSRLRRLNSAALLRVLYGAETLTLSELAVRAAVSRPTTEDVVNELIEQGWVTEAEPGTERRPAVGRPARQFRFRADSGHVLGIDIGAHKVLVLLADLTGTVVARDRATVTPDLPAKERLDITARLIASTLATAEIVPSRVLATAVSSSGILSPEGKVVLSTAINDWTGLELADALHSIAPGHISLDNDINLAALAEHWRGAAQDSPDIVYLHAGWRMGTGILLNGRPHRGRHGGSGEIGGLSLLRWKDAYRRFIDREGSGSADPIVDVFYAAAAHNPEAIQLIDAFAADLAQGLAAVVLTVDPELVIIGGGISQAGDLFLNPVRRHLSDEVLFPIPVIASTLGEDSAAIGAIRLALDQVERQLFDTE
jgi:predicted NBD/HSP70 family sugar kinase